MTRAPQHSATYSPEDNKLRLYPAYRLGKDEYQRVKDAGFAWAPKQEIFVAGMWTPEREDLLVEMCGEIGDEDTSLVDRAEWRAERFEGYSERRAEDAARARDYVEGIAGGIPLGQPILVGHHSERHARRDAEKIENGMRKAVKMWETSQYWERRAAGALRAAKYKETPAVRHRRIKGLESDKRKQGKLIGEAEKDLALWAKVCGPDSTIQRKDGGELTAHERAVFVLGRMSSYFSRCFPLADFPRNPPASQYEGSMSLYSALKDGVINVDQAEAFFRESCANRIERAARWAAHYENRIAYERAMLGESGGLVAERFNIAIGGRVLIGGEWLLVLKLNKAGGKLASVTTNGAYVAVRGIEEITDYREPDAQELAEVRAATKLAPICNYPGEGFRHMTRAEYDAELPKWSDFPKVRTIKGTDTAGAHRVRCNRAPGKPSYEYAFVYITDEKRKDPPNPAAPIKLERKFAPARQVTPRTAETLEALTEDMFSLSESGKRRYGVKYEYAGEGIAECYQFDDLGEVLAFVRDGQTQPRMVSLAIVTHDGGYENMRTVWKWRATGNGAEFDAMKAALRSGNAVTTVSAPQLFPTPKELAERIVLDEAAIPNGSKLDILEPSAGTGRLLEPLFNHELGGGRVVAVEINAQLAGGLRSQYPSAEVKHNDFLSMMHAELGSFDRIIMNPPFTESQDIAHVQHAYKFLKPGGRIVAVLGEGAFFRSDRKATEFREWLEAVGGECEKLPAGSFEASGTGVNTRLVVIDAPEVTV
jgi:phospholipid N-methyltransferase